jgi:hypothetical protein
MLIGYILLAIVIFGAGAITGVVLSEQQDAMESSKPASNSTKVESVTYHGHDPACQCEICYTNRTGGNERHQPFGERWLQ